MNKQRGFLDFRALESMIVGWFIAVLLVAAVSGWAIIEGVIWLFKHVSITIG